MYGRAIRCSPVNLGASDAISHSRNPIRYLPLSSRSSAPCATSCCRIRCTVATGRCARREMSDAVIRMCVSSKVPSTTKARSTIDRA